MLLQTNSYIVPRDKRDAHARLLRKFRQVLLRLGCEHFEAYEQVGTNWSPGEATGRYVQIMRFRDRHHQQQVQAAERTDPGAQAVIREFCELINFPYQQQQGLFASGFYQSAIPVASSRRPPDRPIRAAGAAVPPAASVTPPIAPSADTHAASQTDPPAPESPNPNPIIDVEADQPADDEDCLPGLLTPPAEADPFVSDEIEEDADSAEDEQIDFDADESSQEPTDDDRYPASR